jgi:hypothetical protein
LIFGRKKIWLDHLYPALSTLIDQGGAVRNQGAIKLSIKVLIKVDKGEPVILIPHASPSRIG